MPMALRTGFPRYHDTLSWQMGQTDGDRNYPLSSMVFDLSLVALRRYASVNLPADCSRTQCCTGAGAGAGRDRPPQY